MDEDDAEKIAKIIEDALKRERRSIQKFKEIMKSKKPIKRQFHLNTLTNRWRSWLGLKPIYSGIPTKDKEVIDEICKLAEYDEKMKKKTFDSSGEENYEKAFMWLLKETTADTAHIERILMFHYPEV
ncbi:MAG: hypothetical protein KJ646_00805 [Nanoarchaeota archaeon]|nr:hypothetical protein [Nanoarchaeota archaeon]